MLVDYKLDQSSGTSVPNLAPGSTFGAATAQNGVDGQWSGGSLNLTGGSNGNWVRLPHSLPSGKEYATVTAEVKMEARLKNTNHCLWYIGIQCQQEYLPRARGTTST